MDDQNEKFILFIKNNFQVSIYCVRNEVNELFIYNLI